MYFSTLKKTVKNLDFLVEADSFATHELWAQFCVESPRKFEAYSGLQWLDHVILLERIGTLGGRPVNLSIHPVTLTRSNVEFNVGFYDVVSQVADYRMVEEWIEENFNKTYSGGRKAVTNAMNFHHVLGAMEEKIKGVT